MTYPRNANTDHPIRLVRKLIEPDGRVAFEFTNRDRASIIIPSPDPEHPNAEKRAHHQAAIKLWRMQA